MGITAVQQEGLSTNPTFQAQVNAVVRTQALEKNKPELDDNNRRVVAEVAKYPSNYAFPENIVAEDGWGIKFDQWAADPNHADVTYAILVNVQKVFNLLTGYKPPEPPEEPAP